MKIVRLPGKRRNIVVRGRCIITRDDGAILFQRDKNTGKYVLPGGRLEYQETLPLCLLREMQEEAGIMVKPERLVYVVEIVEDTGRVPDKHEILFYFKCSYEGVPKSQNRYIELEWRLPEEVKDNFWPTPLIKYILRDSPDFQNPLFLVIENNDLKYAVGMQG